MEFIVQRATSFMRFINFLMVFQNGKWRKLCKLIRHAQEVTQLRPKDAHGHSVNGDVSSHLSAP